MSQSFEKLSEFIKTTMSMQHIYQPVFIKTLLENGGSATAQTIAKEILTYDVSQQDYYKNIVNTMPSKVLRNHDIVKKDYQVYSLSDVFNDITPSEARLLVAYCDEKIAKFLHKHGDQPFNHRKTNREALSGTLRYDIITRAGGRCEACGISSKDKALEVDHIVPVNQGGSNDLSNLQALCYTCNAQKRDRDDTDFAKVHESYSKRDNKCIFCNPKDNGVTIVDENELCLAFRDSYPVSEGHTLIIPKRHVSDYFDLHSPERNAIEQLLQRQREALKLKYKDITGFNVGVNCGEDAGQSIFHVHVHLIPRRKGDMKSPKGGVRGVIPEKQAY
jgi:diadenosine tetraphosphate (Ap4A) HIT family hydrolase